MQNKKLKPFIGKWKTSGVIEKSPFGPEGILSGYDKYEWAEDKDFVLHKVAVKMGRTKIKNCEVISFDPQKKKFAMYAFDKGLATGMQYGYFLGRKWLVDGKGIRFRGQFNSTFTKLVGEWQYKAGSKWKRWMTLELNK